MCRESRAVSDTTFAPSPAAWSFMFSQVTPRLGPKYLRFGHAYTAGTGTTNRVPSIPRPARPQRLGERQIGLGGDQRRVGQHVRLGRQIGLGDVAEPVAL